MPAILAKVQFQECCCIGEGCCEPAALPSQCSTFSIHSLRGWAIPTHALVRGNSEGR